MDSYTAQLKNWLNTRFSSCDEHGVYLAHQPIYGFRKGPCEPGQMNRYVITHRLLEALRHLEFKSLLDVGGAEGYKAFLVHKFFGVPVSNTDLSEEACKRAEEIFGIESQPSDIHHLLFNDDQYDVVTCSETLEHVTDWKLATYELLRVAKKAIVITVPQDSKRLIESNKAAKEIHSHIHHFDLNSFNYLKLEGYRVTAIRIFSSLLVIPFCLVDAKIRVHNKNWRHPQVATKMFNLLAAQAKKICGERAAEFLIWIDQFFCKMLPFHQTNLFVIEKNMDVPLQQKVGKHVPIKDIVGFSVSPYYLKK